MATYLVAELNDDGTQTTLDVATIAGRGGAQQAAKDAFNAGLISEGTQIHVYTVVAQEIFTVARTIDVIKVANRSPFDVPGDEDDDES